MQQLDLTSDFFELFSIPVSFEINIPELTSKYRELQRIFHPDKFASAPDAERRISVQMAARINEGYQVLKDPLLRSRYLLEMNGIKVNDTETSLDNMFLMEQMELRETLGELAENSSPESEIKTFKNHIATRVNEILAHIREIFKQNDTEQLQKVAELTKKLQFFRKLEEEANDFEERLLEY